MLEKLLFDVKEVPGYIIVLSGWGLLDIIMTIVKWIVNIRNRFICSSMGKTK